jgi:hypothetical protein
MAKKRRGGQELPDDVQDRPEQNAGYDDAVEFGDALETRDALETESLESDSPGDELSEVPDEFDLPDDSDEA